MYIAFMLYPNQILFNPVLSISNINRKMLKGYVCKNQAKWEKLETCMSKPHRSDDVISLKDTFSF